MSPRSTASPTPSTGVHGPSTEKQQPTLGIDRTSQDTVAARRTSVPRGRDDGIFDDEIAPDQRPAAQGRPRASSRPTKASGPTRPSRPWPASAPRSSRTGPSPPATPPRSPTAPPRWSLASREFAEENGLDLLAVVGQSGQVAGPDNSLHSQPSNAITNALERAGWSRHGSGPHRDQRGVRFRGGAVLEGPRTIPLEQCNIHGGAIALGHPIGASGAGSPCTPPTNSSGGAAARPRSRCAAAAARAKPCCCTATDGGANRKRRRRRRTSALPG